MANGDITLIPAAPGFDLVSCVPVGRQWVGKWGKGVGVFQDWQQTVDAPLHEILEAPPRTINTEDYFSKAKPFTVEKTATIRARPAREGEAIETVVGGFAETKNTAKAGDYVVTNPGGEQYIVSGDRFAKNYTETGEQGVFKPSGGPKQAINLDEDVTFTAPWGEQMHVKKGGVLIRHGPGDIAGVQPEEFASTYSRKPEADRTLSSLTVGELGKAVGWLVLWARFLPRGGPVMIVRAFFAEADGGFEAVDWEPWGLFGLGILAVAAVALWLGFA